MADVTTPRPHDLPPKPLVLYLSPDPSSGTEEDDSSVEYILTVTKGNVASTPSPATVQESANARREQSSNDRKRKYLEIASRLFLVAPPTPKPRSRFAWARPMPGSSPRTTLFESGVPHQDPLGRYWCVTEVRIAAMWGLVLTTSTPNFCVTPILEFETGVGATASLVIVVNPRPEYKDPLGDMARILNHRYRLNFRRVKTAEDARKLSEFYDGLVESVKPRGPDMCYCALCYHAIRMRG